MPRSAVLIVVAALALPRAGVAQKGPRCPAARVRRRGRRVTLSGTTSSPTSGSDR